MKIVLTALACLVLWGCKSQDGSQQESQQQQSSTDPKENHFSVPLGNGIMGRGRTGEYIVYTDSLQQREGHNVFTIKSVHPQEFATIISSIRPEKCIGKRVEYTAWVKSDNIKGWAGLWLRIDPVDPSNKPPLGFDNMQNRPIKGTNDWTLYHVVLDVPEGATNLVYGVLLDGDGQVWVDAMDVRIVDKSVPKTDSIGHRVL